jgi:hypothetical protein
MSWAQIAQSKNSFNANIPIPFFNNYITCSNDGRYIAFGGESFNRTSGGVTGATYVSNVCVSTNYGTTWEYKLLKYTNVYVSRNRSTLDVNTFATFNDDGSKLFFVGTTYVNAQTSGSNIFLSTDYGNSLVNISNPGTISTVISRPLINYLDYPVIYPVFVYNNARNMLFFGGNDYNIYASTVTNIPGTTNYSFSFNIINSSSFAFNSKKIVNIALDIPGTTMLVSTESGIYYSTAVSNTANSVGFTNILNNNMPNIVGISNYGGSNTYFALSQPTNSSSTFMFYKTSDLNSFTNSTSISCNSNSNNGTIFFNALGVHRNSGVIMFTYRNLTDTSFYFSTDNGVTFLQTSSSMTSYGLPLQYNYYNPTVTQLNGCSKIDIIKITDRTTIDNKPFQQILTCAMTPPVRMAYYALNEYSTNTFFIDISQNRISTRNNRIVPFTSITPLKGYWSQITSTTDGSVIYIVSCGYKTQNNSGIINYNGIQNDYFSTNMIFRSTNYGYNWVQVGMDISSVSIESLYTNKGTNNDNKGKYVVCICRNSYSLYTSASNSFNTVTNNNAHCLLFSTNYGFSFTDLAASTTGGTTANNHVPFIAITDNGSNFFYNQSGFAGTIIRGYYNGTNYSLSTYFSTAGTSSAPTCIVCNTDGTYVYNSYADTISGRVMTYPGTVTDVNLSILTYSGTRYLTTTTQTSTILDAYMISCDSTGQYVCGVSYNAGNYNNLIFYSTDFAVTFNTITINNGGSLRFITMNNKNHNYVAAIDVGGGQLFRTSNFDLSKNIYWTNDNIPDSLWGGIISYYNPTPIPYNQNSNTGFMAVGQYIYMGVLPLPPIVYGNGSINGNGLIRYY